VEKAPSQETSESVVECLGLRKKKKKKKRRRKSKKGSKYIFLLKFINDLIQCHKGPRMSQGEPPEGTDISGEGRPGEPHHHLTLTRTDTSLPEDSQGDLLHGFEHLCVLSLQMRAVADVALRDNEKVLLSTGVFVSNHIAVVVFRENQGG
jgi:hypothetical protein